MNPAESVPGCRRVLITRPRFDAEPLAALLAEHGIDSLIEPLMRAVFDSDARDGLSDALAGVQALVATSANGVRAFAAIEPRRDLPVCAVGEATAAAARAVGFTEIQVAGGDVDALAATIVARRDPARGPLLHVAGTLTAGDLAGALSGAGFVCRRVVLYRMEPARALSAAARQALREETLAGVALYSPRTARIFAALLAAEDLDACCRRLTAFCLSAAVAGGIAHLPWASRVIAARPDQPAMVAAIAKHNGSHR